MILLPAVQRSFTGIVLLLIAMFSSAPLVAETYQAQLAVCAGAQGREAGDKVTLVVPIERQLYEDTGERMKTLNPDRVRLTTAKGEDVQVQARAVRLPGTESLGCELQFAVDQAIKPRQQISYVLTFQTVGAEMVRNAPDLAAERVPVSYQAGDWAATEQSRAWDFDDADQPQMLKPWHATCEEGVEDAGYLVAVADGQYSSPVIGHLPGPIDGGTHSRLLIRARRKGATAAKLLINSKQVPVNAAGDMMLSEDFDLYSIDMAGRAGWSDQVEQLGFRWGYGKPWPTAEDQIHIDWVRLLPAGNFAFVGRLSKVDDHAMQTGIAMADIQKVTPPSRNERPTLEAFFAKAPDLAADLPADEIYPRGQIMPLSMYSVGGGVHPLDKEGKQLTPRQFTNEERLAIQKRFADAGFTMIGPQYELNDRAIEDADRLGLKCIYTIAATAPDGRKYNFHKYPDLKPDLEHVKRQVTEMVQSVADSRAIAWWDIVPEEARYWRADEMAYMQAMYDAVKAADPLKRPVFMYEPGHRSASSLAKTMSFQDLSMKGTYTNYAGKRDQRIWVRWSMQQQVNAIELAGRDDVAPMLLPEMFQQPSDELLSMIPAWVRHDVYLGMVCGAKGMVTFSLRKRLNFDAHEQYYQAYADVVGELTGDKQLAKLFLFGQRRQQIYAQVTAGPDRVILTDDFGARLGGPIEYPSITWLDAAHPTLGRYLVIVNSANEPTTVRIDNLPLEAITATEVLAGTTQSVTDGAYSIDLQPLGVQVWRYEQAR